MGMASAVGALVLAIAASAATLSPIAMSVEQFRALPPVEKTVRISGLVIDTYVCPPCPKGAMCKPCMSASAVFIADTLPVAENPAPVSVGIEVPEPSAFRKGARYLFDVAVENANAPIVGRMLDSRPVE